VKPNAFAVGQGWSAVLARLVLGYVIALPVIVPQVARYLGARYTLAITLQSPTTGSLEIVHDLGQGFAHRPFATVPLHPSDKPHQYKLELPPGRYHRLRIDPRTTAARYTITKAAILSPDASLRTPMALDALVPLSQVAIVERTSDRLVVEAPPGGTDPQLLFTPQAPIVIPSHVLNPVGSSAFTIAILWLCGIGAVRVVELAFHGFRIAPALARAGAACESHPRKAVAVVAVAATVLSSYPILFLGRSLFSPNIGGVPMLYGDAPFTPGSTDSHFEDPRGSDVWAAILQDIPHSVVQRAALAEGEFPLWNRHNAAGRPLWGQGLSFLLDPLHWLTLVTPNVALGSDWKFVAHRLVFALGVGLAALATTGAVVPSMIAASAAPFAGVYAFRLNHPGIFVLTYAPWILLGWCQLTTATDRRQRARAALLLAISSALLLLAANPKDAAIALPGLALAGTITVLTTAGSWRDRGRRLFVAGLAGVAVVLVTAPHWVIFLDTLGQAYTVYDRPYVQFATQQHATAFFLGSLTAGPALTGLNLLALVLITAALSAPRRLMTNRTVLACTIVAIILIAIAFGALPATRLVEIPFIGNIGHIHDTFLTAALPLLMVVAAMGAQVLVTGGLQRISIVALAGTLSCWWLFTDVGRYLRHDGFSPGAILLLAPVVITLPWCFYAERLHPGRLLPKLAVVSSMLALLLPGGLHAMFGIPELDELVIQPRQRPSYGQSSPVVDAIHRASADPSRAIGVNWTLIESSHAIYGLEGIGGADPLEVSSYKQLVDATAMWRSMWVTVVWNRDVQRVTPLLDVFNVGYFVGRSDVALPEGVIEIPTPRPDRLKPGRRPTAWPRAFFVDGVTTYDDPTDLLNQVTSAGRPFAAVQAGDAPAADATRGMGSPSGRVIAATRYRLTSNTTSFAVRAPGPGVAVLTETFLPEDFHATLNGTRVPYFRVNQAFKAVRIPSSGDWVVKFEYRPARWELSLGLAGLGLALLGGLGFAARAPRYALDATLRENPALRASS
jgi:hypothetical protein